MVATAQGLCEFIDASPSPFHVCATVASRLRAAGYTELAEADEWPRAGKFFIVRAGSLVAWNSGNDAGGRPFRVIGGHTDSPNLRVKQHPDREVAGWQMVALEPYGGAWLNSWLDRDLGVSGRLSVRDGTGIAHRLVRIDNPDPAGAAAGDPPGRGPQVAHAGSAAPRQRGVGRRRRDPIVHRLCRRAGRRRP